MEAESWLETGARVFLREPREEDRSEWLALRLASRDLHAPWEPELFGGVDPASDEAFDRYLDQGRDGRRQRLLVCRAEKGAIVGSFSLAEIVRGIQQSAQLGYWVGAPFARQGYMRAGLELLLRHAFRRLHLHRLEANIQPDNEASRRLVRGAGFRLEGYSPRLILLRGTWRDHERWALTVEEWGCKD